MNWHSRHKSVDISLVLGNHDTLPKHEYHNAGFNLCKKLKLEPFLFVHNANDVNKENMEEKYLLSGHIHPAVKLRNRGRQQMKLPCFYFGKNWGLLPAFGVFTGTHIIKPQKSDTIYIVANKQVLPSSGR